MSGEKPSRDNSRTRECLPAVPLKCAITCHACLIDSSFSTLKSIREKRSDPENEEINFFFIGHRIATKFQRDRVFCIRLYRVFSLRLFEFEDRTKRFELSKNKTSKHLLFLFFHLFRRGVMAHRMWLVVSQFLRVHHTRVGR